MDDERDTTNQPLPGSVSNQNGEEAEPGHGGGSETHRKPSDTDEHPSGGEAGEGSQSTGDPRSAG